jgi:hypothetical protein
MEDLLQDKQNFFRHFLTVAPKHCDNCGAKYNESDFKVINSNNNNIVLHLKCNDCKNTYVLNVMNQPNGMVGAQRIPFNSDINSDFELEFFAGAEGVSPNEALDLLDQLDPNINKEKLQNYIFN